MKSYNLIERILIKLGCARYTLVSQDGNRHMVYYFWSTIFKRKFDVYKIKLPFEDHNAECEYLRKKLDQMILSNGINPEFKSEKFYE